MDRGVPTDIACAEAGCKAANASRGGAAHAAPPRNKLCWSGPLHHGEARRSLRAVAFRHVVFLEQVVARHLLLGHIGELKNEVDNLVLVDRRAKLSQRVRIVAIKVPDFLLAARRLASAIDQRAGEVIMLHAAGLALPDGRVVAFVAPSGTGKTTLSRTLGKAFGYVSDETVVINFDGTVTPYPKPLSVIRSGHHLKRQLFGCKSERFEQVSQGTLSILVKNGVMHLEEMHRTKVSRQQLFAALRNNDIHNLGDVDRVYLEACGLISIYRRSEPRAGLPLFPPNDASIAGFRQNGTGSTLVCANCGTVPETPDKNRHCPVCDATQWGTASISASRQSESHAL